MSTPNQTSVTEKWCGMCHETKPASCYTANKSARDGLYSYCRDCKTIYERRRRKLRTMGRSPWVDAQPVREHVQQLFDAGMTRHQIAELSRTCDRTVVRNLLIGQPPRQGPAKRVHWKTAQALLSVQLGPGQAAPVPAGKTRRAGATIDPTGTRRRLEALLANGWPAGELASRLGAKTNCLQIRKNRRVTSSTAAAVRMLYEQLADVPGPQPKVATLYRGRGYLPPIWWDDDTIDDPIATPSGTAWRPLGEGLGPTIHPHWPRELQVAKLMDWGLSKAKVAEILGCSVQCVARARALPVPPEPVVDDVCRPPGRPLGNGAEDAAWLLEQGLSLDEVAGRLGIQAASLRRAMERAGVVVGTAAA